MTTPPPLRAGEIVVGCVTEDSPIYLGQTLRLVQSIRWFGGELARAQVVVGAVEHIDKRARRSLEAFDADIRIVPRFDARNGSANRLQIFPELRDAEPHYLLLDCDTIIVRDPLPLLRRDVFQAKIAPFPTVTHEVFERLFAHFGLALPPRTYTTGYSGTPTIPYFNAGVFSISRALADRLVPEWRRYNAILAAQPALTAPCEKHLHQAALALALAATRIPVAEAGAELNYQVNATQFPTPRGYAEIDPYIIHYHDRVDASGRLLPVPFPTAQERIDRFHERLAEEHSRDRGLARHEGAVTASSKQIAVMGMHRSGTSIVARLLNAMGCYAGGSPDLAPPDVFNPTGYWERRDVLALDDEVLAALGANWLEPPEADLAKLASESLQALVERARAIVRTLDEHGTWMIKDPRLGIVFPIWREALDRPVCVLVWREPAAVARSLEHRDGLPFVIGLGLWEGYTRAMLADTAGLPRVLVSYQELIADPLACVSKLHRDLVAAGAADLRLPPEHELRSMVDPDLDHNGGDDEGLLNRHQSELCDALRSSAVLEWETVPAIHPQTRSLISSYWMHGRDDAPLRKQKRELELMLDSVFASRSWRLGFAITRLWRKLVPSNDETTWGRWRKMRGRE